MSPLVQKIYDSFYAEAKENLSFVDLEENDLDLFTEFLEICEEIGLVTYVDDTFDEGAFEYAKTLILGGAIKRNDNDVYSIDPMHWAYDVAPMLKRAAQAMYVEMLEAQFKERGLI